MRNSLLILALFILALAPAVSGCDEDDAEVCRYDPSNCDSGDPGGFCNSNRDCDSGYCCTDNGNCAGGMCTFRCDNDNDCPVTMACEHGSCFFACERDEHCAVGQSCEHGNTVCEW